MAGKDALLSRFMYYPKDYNPRVHGAYDPARFYGKPDTPLSQVKLNELWSWLGRRNMTPSGAAGLVHRGYWRWLHKYKFPKNAGGVYLIQATVLASAFFYCIQYKAHKLERHAKYHW